MQGFEELGSLPNKQNGPFDALQDLDLCPCGASLPQDCDVILRKEIPCPNRHFCWLDSPQGSLVSRKALLVMLWPRGLLGS